jgi:hypothetical protein
MATALEKELARRAADKPPASWRPKLPSSWTPAGVIAIVMAMGGPAVVVPLLSAWTSRIEAEAQAAKALAESRAKEIERLEAEVGAARRTCDTALEEARAARSQATAARVVAEAIAGASKR